MTAMSEFIKPAHKSVARSIGYALTTGDSDGWNKFTAIALLRLNDAERMGMAYAALRSLHPDHVEATLEAALVWVCRKHLYSTIWMKRCFGPVWLRPTNSTLIA